MGRLFSANPVHRRRIDNELSRLRRGISTRKLTANLHSSGRANGPVLRLFPEGERRQRSRCDLRLREQTISQAGLQICFLPETEDRSAIFASSPLLEKTEGRGHWPGQMSGGEWLTFSLKYSAADGSFHCLSFFYAQNLRMNPFSALIRMR